MRKTISELDLQLMRERIALNRGKIPPTKLRPREQTIRNSPIDNSINIIVGGKNGLKYKTEIISNSNTDQTLRINIKPLSVNATWQGQRFKTKEYTQYQLAVTASLPILVLPQPPYEIHFNFGFTTQSSDYDNPIKPLQDTICRHYKINDNLIYKAVIEKFVVGKGNEYFEFKILHYEKQTPADKK